MAARNRSLAPQSAAALWPSKNLNPADLHVLLVDDEVLSECFLGMKMNAQVITLDIGLTILDSVYECLPSFHKLIINEIWVDSKPKSVRLTRKGLEDVDEYLAEINGTGEQTRDYVYVGDVVAANMTVTEREDLTGAYNVGTGVETSVNELYAAITEALGVKIEPRHAPAEKSRDASSSRPIEARAAPRRPRSSGSP